MKHFFSSVTLLALAGYFNAGKALGQAAPRPIEKAFLDSTFQVLPSAAGAYYRRETEYTDSVRGVVRDYYLSGQLQSREEFENLPKRLYDGVTETFDRNGQLTMHTEFAHGSRTGELRLYYPSGQLKRREQYAGIGLPGQGGECFAPDGKPLPYFAYEIMPRYPEGDGGTQAIVRAIARNFHYPKDARRAGVEGKVLVAFVVTAQGLVAEAQVKQSLYPSIDAEAIKAVYQLKRFEPGQQDGKPVKVGFTVPIALRLQ